MSSEVSDPRGDHVFLRVLRGDNGFSYGSGQVGPCWSHQDSSQFKELYPLQNNGLISFGGVPKHQQLFIFTNLFLRHLLELTSTAAPTCSRIYQEPPGTKPESCPELLEPTLLADRKAAPALFGTFQNLPEPAPNSTEPRLNPASWAQLSQLCRRENSKFTTGP